MATHAALDRLRSPSFRRTGEWRIEPEEGRPDLDDREVGSGEKPSLEQQVVRKEMNLCVQVFVGRLPETYREVLVLREWEGLSNEEIAGALGLSLDNVKIRLHGGRKRLRQALEAGCDPHWVEGNEFVPELRHGKACVRLTEQERISS